MSASETLAKLFKGKQPKQEDVSPIPPEFPKEDCPTVVIKFINPQFPEFEFQNWKPGISLGTFERAGQLLIREAQRQQAQFLTKLRNDDAEAET